MITTASNISMVTPARVTLRKTVISCALLAGALLLAHRAHVTDRK